MYQRPLIFLAILAAAAAAFAIVLLTAGGSRAPVGSPLLERTVFGATALELVPAGTDSPVRFELSNGAWILAQDRWPANETAVRGALRLLGETLVAGGGAAPDDRESRVVLEFDDGERTTLWIEPASRAVGGGAVIRDARGVFGRAPAGLAQAIESITKDAWRSPAAMPRVEIEASRVTIERDSETIALARLNARWYLREPARAKADDRAVASLLGAMIDLRALRFGGEPVSEPTSGVRTVTVEKDRRTVRDDGTVSVEADTSTLTVLGPANDAGDETVVESNGVRMVVRTDRLNALDVAPEAVASRTATDAAPADVGMILLRGPTGEIAFRRKVLEWDALGESATRLFDPSQESGGVERLLTFLANARADRVEFAREAPTTDPTRFIQLFGLGDAPLATIAVEWRTTDAGASLVLSNAAESDAPGPLTRTYSAEQTPPLLRAWLELQ